MKPKSDHVNLVHKSFQWLLIPLGVIAACSVRFWGSDFCYFLNNSSPFPPLSLTLLNHFGLSAVLYTRQVPLTPGPMTGLFTAWSICSPYSVTDICSNVTFLGGGGVVLIHLFKILILQISLNPPLSYPVLLCIHHSWIKNCWSI